jgi:hypothetical protein
MQDSREIVFPRPASIRNEMVAFRKQYIERSINCQSLPIQISLEIWYAL